jgi:thiosulfate/3-mercaptopyruvate sulfurtransferase
MNPTFKNLGNFALVILLVLPGINLQAASKPETNTGVDAELGTLVSTQWLSEHLDDPDLVVLDCTVLITQGNDGSMNSISGRGSYEQGHIPGAVFADLVNDLSDTESPYEFTLPTAEKLAGAFGDLGVGDQTRVVLYDSMGTVFAARAWWMLRWLGFDRAAILDGGINAWKAEGRPLSTESAKPEPKQLSARVRPELIAYQDEVRGAINNDQVRLIDAMPASHYKGEMVMYDWPGHIPGAINVPSFSLLDESGRYRPMDELREMLGSSFDTRNITYCGGGISAASDAFILTRLGFTNVAVYDGSLAEWTQDPDNPMEVDE